MSWSTFLKAHWGAIAATDLFTVEVVNPFGLVRYHVLFVIDIATRCVCIGGMTSDPNGEWMKQAARNLTDMWDGFLLGKRYLIHDRDPLFTEAVRGLLRDSGVKPLRLPANSPNLNAYAERFVLSIRREWLTPIHTKKKNGQRFRYYVSRRLWLERIKAGKTYEEIATEDAITTARVRKAIRYAFLAPDIVRAVVDGRQPVGLASSYLLHHPLPDDWEKQRALVATL